MDALHVVVVAGAVVAGFVQGLSGFGYGLTAMSVWAWSIDPRLAAALVVFGSLTGQLIAAFSVRRGFDWRRLLPFLLGGLVGIPIGVRILPMLDVHMFKALLGGFLVLWCPLMLAVKYLPRITAGGRLADAVVGGLGGVMGGIGGFTGTLPTLWCTLRGFARDEQRSIIQNFNLGTLLVTMATYVGTGIVTADMLPLFGLVALAMLIPTVLGTRLYLGISDQAFRRIVLGLLTLSGVAMLASSLPRLL
ncbi:sulfite exporter TauE/SafE family protein [Bordetella bronchiseptica]|uniref:Probable membrane transporter protein n=2 Tax=Bordetella bronchiseptica TaxID=518 RepID=A0A0C6P456_BORBO|nr:sulfite exporter TauE/SafE family protein [Bordetella bronchiseptica]KCV32957.1 sulfite exporter TauE/SafE [Bordetella bronchiseptica 00-P-2730]KDD63301.1 sulfite exporter TauE/SafE [Bordetella bronchiseptica OSU553]SHS75249.1 Sulfite exporter TauE/SafE [Mycobacteroides abscessus subsp. abscessus]AUL15078.1 permease [Bordetella bronchiseptica]AWP58177.1 anion permease [Bordetella bronchiseptica]